MTLPTPISHRLLMAALLSTAFAADSVVAFAADPPGHVTGVGGIFFTSKHPKALAAWYRDMLGLPVESWGGAALRYDAPQHPPLLVWNVFPTKTSYFAPSHSPLMINFAVDSLDAILQKLKAKGVAVIKQDTTDPNGKFAWILDPDGNKVELWEPKPPPAHSASQP